MAVLGMRRHALDGSYGWLGHGVVVLAVATLALGRPEPATARDVVPVRTDKAVRLPILTLDSPGPPGPFVTCTDQTYALCAAAKCFVFNTLAYCACDVKHGDSISLPFVYAPGKDVCTANADGVGNGYMLSTFSLPDSVRPPEGNQALYTCPASSTGAYAQCDGGFCFDSTRGKTFPGFDEALGPDEIVCSCPITVPANPETALIGFQIAGPYPCQQEFFANCDDPPAGNSTGDTIYVGAPTGTASILTELLYGFLPPVNRCFPATE